jgi:hypothetical protein
MMTDAVAAKIAELGFALPQAAAVAAYVPTVEVGGCCTCRASCRSSMASW